MYNLLPSRATGYVARELAIFPLLKGSKLPATEHGASDAAVDDSPWRRNPDFNIALHMGKNRLVLIDLDSHAHDGEANPCKQGEADGLAWLAAAKATHGAGDFQTWHSLTPTGGQHLFYRVPPGFDCDSLKQSASIARHVDFKAGNQYAVVDPSLHPAGGYYSWNWTEGLDPFNCDVLDCPPWLLALLPRKVLPPATSNRLPLLSTPPVLARLQAASEQRRAATYGPAMLQGALDDLSRAMQGERHNKLLAKSVRVGALARACNLDVGDIERRLMADARRLGLPESEISNTVGNGLRYGLDHSDDLPPSNRGAWLLERAGRASKAVKS